MGHGFRCIHLVDNTSMNLDAIQDNKDSSQVHEGNSLGLSYWREDDYLQWKIVPWCPMENDCESHNNLEVLVPRGSEVEDGPDMQEPLMAQSCCHRTC